MHKKKEESTLDNKSKANSFSANLFFFFLSLHFSKSIRTVAVGKRRGAAMEVRKWKNSRRKTPEDDSFRVSAYRRRFLRAGGLIWQRGMIVAVETQSE